jgi:hypothetical protein
MKVWDSIDDLPIFFYNKINETGELSYLVEGWQGVEVDKKTKLKLQPAMENVELEMFQMMGSEPQYQLYLDDLKRLYISKIKGAVENDTLAKINTKVYESELNKNKSVKFHDTMAFIHKSLSTYIDPKIMSTRYYYTHLNILSKKNNNG